MSYKKLILLGIQYVCAIFSSTVLVGLLCNIPMGLCLCTAGIGTIFFELITRFKVPVFLGSSFSFIPALIMASGYGQGFMAGGVIASGLFYILIGAVISRFGTKWINKLLPPIVIGTIIICIGIFLAPTAVSMAITMNGEYSNIAVIIALCSLIATLIYSKSKNEIVQSIPVLLGILTGYLISLVLNVKYQFIPFDAVENASWVGIPFIFEMPKFKMDIVITFIILSVSTLCEHIGDMSTISKVCDKNYLEDPGLSKTIMGDGCATLIAGLLGGPNNTSYGEGISVAAITGEHSVYPITVACIITILLSFCPKFNAILNTINPAIFGGCCIVLFGTIASSGVRTLVDAKIDFTDKNNFLIFSIMIVMGIGGMVIKIGQFQLSSLALSLIAGIILNLILNRKSEKENV